ncbi:hypothetical protein, partial [Mesorhizobium sp. M0968]|uniref:hypothetical protein n=1 Tax=Mesorhizobium sp. M0968 TaxID=2957037 RepID=UPI00333B3BF2
MGWADWNADRNLSSSLVRLAAVGTNFLPSGLALPVPAHALLSDQGGVFSAFHYRDLVSNVLTRPLKLDLAERCTSPSDLG